MAKTIQEVLSFNDVSLHYEAGHPILKNLSFTINKGDFYFLTGPSGAGKSSLMKLMYLGHRPSYGHIKIFGSLTDIIPPEQIPLFRQKIGVVFQNFRLINHLTVIENVLLPLRVQERDQQTSYNQAIELLSWVGLSNYLHAYPNTLSGGQKQRVAIARAVVTNPSLLLADEPTGNVDGEIAMKLLHLFEELNRQGTAVIIATHNTSLVERFPYSQFHLENGVLKLKNKVKMAMSDAAILS